MNEYFVLDGRKFVAVETPVVPRPRLWRVRHFLECDDDRRSRPEVNPLFPNHYSHFGKEAQLLSRAMNFRITSAKWSQVYSYHLWITNEQGFGNSDDPRANYVTGEDLDYAAPKVEALLCGGNVVTGEPEAGLLHVATLDWRNMPSLEWIMARPWFITKAVAVDGNGKPRRFPQGEQPNGEMVDILHPLIADPVRYEITIPLRRLQEWTEPELPDPYMLYEV
jgi:hypothetical protein